MKLYSVVLVLRQNRVLPNESFSGDRNHGMIYLYMKQGKQERVKKKNIDTEGRKGKSYLSA